MGSQSSVESTTSSSSSNRQDDTNENSEPQTTTFDKRLPVAHSYLGSSSIQPDLIHTIFVEPNSVITIPGLLLLSYFLYNINWNRYF